MIENAVRAALFDKLAASSAVTSLLPHGTLSIINERDLARDVDMPVIVLHGGRGYPLDYTNSYQIWDVCVYTDAEDYVALDAILQTVNNVLDEADLPIDPGTGYLSVNTEYAMTGESDEDPALQLHYKFYRYRVWIAKIGT